VQQNIGSNDADALVEWRYVGFDQRFRPVSQVKPGLAVMCTVSSETAFTNYRTKAPLVKAALIAKLGELGDVSKLCLRKYQTSFDQRNIY
jgi:hypothetical protein